MQTANCRQKMNVERMEWNSWVGEMTVNEDREVKDIYTYGRFWTI